MERKDNVLNYFKIDLTNASTESFNSKLKGFSGTSAWAGSHAILHVSYGQDLSVPGTLQHPSSCVYTSSHY